MAPLVLVTSRHLLYRQELSDARYVLALITNNHGEVEMKNLRAVFGSMLVFAATSSVAASNGEEPSPILKCELSYLRVNSDGSTAEYEVGESVSLRVAAGKAVATKVVMSRGYALAVKLERICASDEGSCTNSFDTVVTIRQLDKVEIAATSSFDLKAGQESVRSSTTLNIGAESRSASCFVN